VKVLSSPESLSALGLKASRVAAGYALKPVTKLFLEDFESLLSGEA